MAYGKGLKKYLSMRFMILRSINQFDNFYGYNKKKMVTRNKSDQLKKNNQSIYY